jgi:adenosylcobinamide-GDP ribazoletransferase
VLALLSLSLTNTLLSTLLAGLSGLGMAWLAQRQIGGQTGDVLGAIEQGAETAALLAAAAWS